MRRIVQGQAESPEFFNKSLVRSFSSFEKLRHRPDALPVRPGFALIDIACSRLLVRTLDCLGSAVMQLTLGYAWPTTRARRNFTVLVRLK